MARRIISEYKTVADIASEFSVTTQRVHQLLREHKLRVIKVNRQMSLVPMDAYRRLKSIRKETAS